MLVSGNMTPQKMGRKVGKKSYFKKKICPIFYLMTHLFPTAQLKKQRCGRSEKKNNIFFDLVVYHMSQKKLQSDFPHK